MHLFGSIVHRLPFAVCRSPFSSPGERQVPKTQDKGGRRVFADLTGRHVAYFLSVSALVLGARCSLLSGLRKGADEEDELPALVCRESILEGGHGAAAFGNLVEDFTVSDVG